MARNYPSSGDIYNGTYTPTFVSSTNVSSYTFYTTNYTRIGNQVFVKGSIIINGTATANTITSVDFTLPIPTSTTNNDDLSGSASTITSTAQQGLPATIYNSSGNARIYFQNVSTSNCYWLFNYSYIIK